NKVTELLGSPVKTEKLSDGDVLYVYSYRTAEPHWWTVDKTSNQRLEITVRDGIVKDYKFRQEGKEAVLRQ
ncbi:MAG: hypothetical protein ABH845_03020, partial [Candidatus Omnitrophota bacterium]